MSALTIYTEDAIPCSERITDFSIITEQLMAIGVQFERWSSNIKLNDDADADSILAAYSIAIDCLNQQYGFQSIDVIHLNTEHPNKVAMRQKFLVEHTHDDFEIRFFVRGCGLFYLHIDAKVYIVLCEQGDLISIPTNTAHWFDLGSEPQLTAIRLFTTTEGWLATFTRSDISLLFPSLDDYIAELK